MKSFLDLSEIAFAAPLCKVALKGTAFEEFFLLAIVSYLDELTPWLWIRMQIWEEQICGVLKIW